MADGVADLLKRVPLFSGLDERELREVASTMKPRTFPSGRALAEEGHGGVGFFVVEEGEATVSVNGREVGKIGPGDYFGEIALVADTPRTATVTADTDVKAHGMTSWEFRPLVETNASIAWKLLESLARKLREAESR